LGGKVEDVTAPKTGVEPGHVTSSSGKCEPRGDGEITAVKGKRMPPGQSSKDWILVDETRFRK